MGASISLHEAAAEGDVKKFLAGLCEPNNSGALEAVDTEGRTPLLVAAGAMRVGAAKRLAVVTEIIERGASMRHKDYRGFGALHYACTTGDLRLVEVLLQAGASPSIDDFGLSPADVLPRGAGGHDDPRLRASAPQHHVQCTVIKDAVTGEFGLRASYKVAASAPAVSPSDYLQVFYITDNPHTLSRRMGAYCYLEGRDGAALFAVPEGEYRVLLISADEKVVAASAPVNVGEAGLQDAMMHELLHNPLLNNRRPAPPSAPAAVASTANRSTESESKK